MKVKQDLYSLYPQKDTQYSGVFGEPPRSDPYFFPYITPLYTLYSPYMPK